MATIEHWKGLPPTSNRNRDARVSDMGSAIQIALKGGQH